MTEALKMVNVSKEITEALVERKGELAKVLDFIECYEIASWSELSRQMILFNIKEGPVYDAYIDALSWYRDLFGDMTDNKQK